MHGGIGRPYNTARLGDETAEILNVKCIHVWNILLMVRPHEIPLEHDLSYMFVFNTGFFRPQELIKYIYIYIYIYIHITI